MRLRRYTFLESELRFVDPGGTRGSSCDTSLGYESIDSIYIEPLGLGQGSELVVEGSAASVRCGGGLGDDALVWLKAYVERQVLVSPPRN